MNASSWSDNPELTAATGGSNLSSSTSSLQSLQSPASPTPIPSAPAAPDISELTGLYQQAPHLFNAKGVANAFDSQIDTTRSQGFQAASNAATSYGAREAQNGINPVAQGAVEAQARAPVYSAVNDLTKSKESAVLDAHQMGANLQAQIASAIGNIRAGYTKTLADYNLGAAQLSAGQQQFGESFGLQQQQFSASQRNALIQALGTQGNSGSPFATWLMKQLGISSGTPGYVPDQGPIDPSTGLPFSNGKNANFGAGITPANSAGLRVA